MDDIWDEPATISASLPRNEPLFLPSDDEEQSQRVKLARPQRKTTQKNTNGDMEDIVGGLFDDLSSGDDAVARPDVKALLAKRAKDVSKTSGRVEDVDSTANGDRGASKQSNDSEEVASKARRVIAKVDDERLLGERGFPALIKEAKRFKPKGKGHEVEDLDRLLGLYQFWSHNMFPKTQFRDTVDRVERVCRSRRMLVNLSMWRDAERPKVIDEDIDVNKQDDSDQENQVDSGRNISGAAPSALSPSRSQAALNIINFEEEDAIWKDMDEAVAELDVNTAERVAPAKPKPVSRFAGDEDDLEDWFNADSESQVPWEEPSASKLPGADDMDIDKSQGIPPNPKRYLSPPTEHNWDEDLFD